MTTKTAVSILKFSLLALGTAVSTQVFAQSATDLTINFSNRSFYSSGSALWNQGLLQVQPTIIVKDWNSGSGNQTTTIDVGDGSDGVFNSSTWSHFGSVDSTNKIIYFDNSAHSTLKATSFTLDAGWTIIPTAAQALKIDVMGDATVNGIIECSGTAGGNVTTSPGSAGAAGSGRCGGGNGGSGGAQRTGTGVGVWNGSNGISLSGSVTPGNGGLITAGSAGAGGGGGGSFGRDVSTPSSGAKGGNATATVGLNGTNHLEPTFVTLEGSAGGGGGSGSSSQAGAGGGGGGGVIVLHVGGNLSIGINGAIRARGGAGGTTSSDGGEGGAGGGGSIETWVGKGITLLATSGDVIDAKVTPITSVNTSHGGDGWQGRTWTSSDSTGTGFVTSGGTIAPAADTTMTEGFSYYTSGSSQNVISAAIDTQSTLATFHSAGFTSTNDPDVTLEIAGSNDAFVSDDTGWLATTSVDDLNNKRYVRFRLSINNSDAVNGTTVSEVKFNYTPGLLSNFDFKSAGCGVVGNSGNPPPPWTGLLLILPLLMWSGLFSRTKNKLSS